MLATPYRFLRDVSMDYDWFAGHGSSTSQLGINDIDFKATFALPMPFFQQPEPPLLITPGFAWHFWDGPSSERPRQSRHAAADLRRLYRRRLESGHRPNAFSAELEASVGIYSDFSQITSQSIRLMGKGMAVIAIPDTALSMKVGVWYINREKIKLLPAGGFVWKPSPLTRVRHPLSQSQVHAAAVHHARRHGMVVVSLRRLWRRGMDHQAFARPHESGLSRGKRPDRPGRLRRYPRGLGNRLHAPGGVVTGFFEGGYAFQRELNYASGLPSSFDPNGAFYVHAGVSF